MATVGIALGSNLGDKLENLYTAREQLSVLATKGTQIISAPIYRTSPVLCPSGSPDFYNTAIEIIYEGEAEQLLSKTQETETLIGRKQKTVINQARCIDIDILYFNDLSMKTEKLELPHPRIHQRRFVLEPLAKICPERILPNQTLTIRQLLEHSYHNEPLIEELQATW